jgi:group I intron endonuclease
MESGIYKIVNIINNNIYIGSAVTLNRRFSQHIRQLNTNKHYNNKLQNSWNKYTEINFNFIIIEYCEKDKLIIREQHYIDKENPNFNICKIAGSKLGTKMSDKQKKHLSKINTGKKLSDETKEKISLSNLGKSKNKGKSLSNETKQKMSESAKKRKRQPHSEETKKKISESRNKLKIIK